MVRVRFVSLVLLAAVAGMPVKPAMATAFADTAAVLFQGWAYVCGETVAGKPPAAECSSSSKGQQGLYMPVVAGDASWMGRRAVYQFATMPVFGNGIPCVALRPWFMPIDCAMVLVGEMAPVAGYGAACGVSTGREGAGELTYADGAEYLIDELGWPPSAGGTVLVHGYYLRSAAAPGMPSKPDPADHTGSIVGVAQVEGGGRCYAGPLAPWGTDGAGTFLITGVLVLI